MTEKLTNMIILKKPKLWLFTVLLISSATAYALFPENKYPPSERDTIIKAPENWFNLDMERDVFSGISTERAYNELLTGKKSRKVVVAILDSGVDYLHEDLKAKIWMNIDEIPDNGIDDDKNGYIDDVRGWNFIGGKDGTPVIHDNYEVTRLLPAYMSKFANTDTTNLSKEDQKEFEFYKKLKADYEKLYDRYAAMLSSLIMLNEKYRKSEQIVLQYLGIDSLSADNLLQIDTDIDSVDIAVEFLTRFRNQELNPKRLENGIEKIGNIVEYNLNMDYDPRYIVGDNYDKPEDRNYGNPLVAGIESMHGTHVSGIIAADRNNQTGISGIADNVEIMILRVVPDGDERDKDVANAVYYAVDNGARIINMSFGKGYSPFKKYVDDAFLYAENKGVLIVHASGNDSENNDKVLNFPSRSYSSGGECKTWIEAGAISWKDGPFRVAGFTNYGKKSVDLFAPGIDIYSTIPDNKYRNANGTSMAAPMVSGVAALVWSYYPDLTAIQLKKVILKSAVRYKKEKVLLPGNPEKIVPFGKLSRTGGVLNAYHALKMADRISR